MATINKATDWTVERDAGKRGWEVNSESLEEQWFIRDEVLESLIRHMANDVEHPFEKEYLLKLISKKDTI